MTWKLALINVKKRWQDYAVLMMGLVVSVAIFYMFQTLSLNTTFLQEAIPTVSIVGFIFQIGSVMLGLLTIVYIFYANSFLLSMRKKEYGMYMMFGAKKSKIKQMMTIETLSIGGLALLIGIFVGAGFAAIMSRVLMKMLELKTNAYSAFSIKAILLTIVFFTILFIFTAIVNNSKFSKTKLLQLLNEEGTSEKYRPNKFKIIGLTLLSVILLGIGYWVIMNLAKIGQMGLVIAMLTITFGTFAFYQALFPLAVNLLKNSNVAQKKLRIFTLSQLSFKANSISRVLAMITMMLALSLGAITVGFGFNNEKESSVNFYPYDVVSNNPTPELIKEINSLPGVDEKVIYHIKEVGDNTYYLYDELKAHPMLVDESKVDNHTIQLNDSSAVTWVPYTNIEQGGVYTYDNVSDNLLMNAFENLDNPYKSFTVNPVYHVLSQADFDQVDAPVLDKHVVRLSSFKDGLSQLKAINNLEVERSDVESFNTSSKYNLYSMMSGMMSGFMFMGAFLGVAFLAMLASCLMFKILSGAHADKVRYEMLNKMGVRKSLLIKSMVQEIGVLFIVPGLLGTAHVLFGLQMFKDLLTDPYANLWLPFVLFAVVYVIYYLFTVVLYKNIVLKDKH
ncbi:FtsX-like permease family protein [Vagococcus xieshaowenii]|uniref:ABC transporter permease n=1 Tax=Vagococcus xieshaowenii TaxID=2562451 RepID=A0AAJ5EFA2_9ENTE|nr:ABC transporter permease [Vagococcus xieshaowenii]QCA28654.1 ABC transporter permease [Vagococcus xieshaowenii]TFZ40539.1 ABC transporter permease [Vagococcus xieshaowenii]